jgi:transposase
MKEITTLGIDLAKNVFHLHGVDKKGEVVFRRKLTRVKVLPFIAQLPKCLVGMEVCGGSNYWAREIRKLGHDVRLMSPQFVKAYLKSNKNDFNDAEAICEAVSRPSMRFVPIKSVDQQDIQALHRIRKLMVRDRTSLVNQTRGLLGEYGIIIARGIKKCRKDLPIILETDEDLLTDFGRELFWGLYKQLLELDDRIKAVTSKIEKVFESNEVCQRLAQLEGVGALSATAIVAAVGDARDFKSGREMAAWLGLVPKQNSTGGRTVLLGISKRGDRYLRTLLIHGARSVVLRADKKDDPRSRWIIGLKKRRGNNIASVALANKNARIIWAMMTKGEEYRKAA